MDTPILEMKQIVKAFPGVVAVNHVDLQVNAGEVLALIGENGAGKSTLIKILAGYHQADEGEIFIGGKKVEIPDPKTALDLGISVIYQELNYMNYMSIAENMLLDQIPRKRSGRVDYARLREKSMEIQKIIGLEKYDPRTTLEELTVGEKQLIEIGKAYARNARIIVMDEPTSALTLKDVDKLFGIIRQLKADGVGIIYISHKMDEIIAIADRVEIMRDGAQVLTEDIGNMTKERMVNEMVGRKLGDMYPVSRREIGEELLRVEHLETDYLKDISFCLHRGEILGLYGLMGAGCEEVLRCLYGVDERQSGDIYVRGVRSSIRSPLDGIRERIFYVPGERKTEGLMLDHSIKENIVVSSVEKFARGARMDARAERKAAEEWSEKLKVKAGSVDVEAGTLSGGNQQKVILAKSLLTEPEVLLLNEPTKGIDVGAKAEIYKLMEEFCEQGLGIIFISSEMPEVMNMSDRLLIIHEGQLVKELDRDEFTQETIMKSAVGE